MARRFTNEEFVKILKERNPIVIPLGEYKSSRTEMWFMCAINNEHKWKTKPQGPLQGKGCPYCADKKRIKIAQKARSKNVIKLSDANPELAKYLLNYEDGLKYGEFSHKEVDWLCPYCKNIFSKKISYMSRRGFKCPFCSKGKSYPNRLMCGILMQLHIDFISEYMPEWSNRKKYDFYFEIKDKKYIIEMDGGFHNGNVMNNISYEDAKNNDNIKDNLAKEHNVYVIRINCDYTGNDRYEYIKNNILKSELVNILDLKSVDFDECDLIANKNMLIEFAEAWEKYHDLDKVCNELHYSKEPSINYLKQTEKYKLSTYCHQDEIINRINLGKEKLSKSKGHAVRCIETGEVFTSIAKAKKKYKVNLSRYFNNPNSQYAGTLPDGTKLHWDEL